MAFNTRSPAVKRLLKEAQELNSPTELYYAQPLEDNIFEWHFTIRGPSETDFDGGIYHGRILLPAEYPMKPPNIILLTPNGRFKTNEKICLSISGYHPETWLPSWSIRTALLALIGFMPTLGEGAIGSLDYESDERKELAKRSVKFTCSICKVENISILPQITEKSQKDCAEAKHLASQIQFKNSPQTAKSTSENSEQPQQQVSNEATNSGVSSAADTNVLTKRNVNTSIQENLTTTTQTTSTPLLNDNVNIAGQTVNRQSGSTINTNTNSNNSTKDTFTYILLILLSALFFVLLIRRVLLLVINDTNITSSN